ncbi:hypothetical protein SCACP_02420 [Sporomusa carbonis]|uniref:Eco57I restriction-modification methylase domain-containing protein n=1 Tax=Sporomusa carbonis TaxID=3076075 RepID=UPI003A68E784
MEENYERQVDRMGRKSAGIFYTPQFIVDYILNQTLARHDVLSRPVPKVLDPACGTGNFLLAAYDLLWDKFNANLDVLRIRYADRQYTVRSGNTIQFLSGEQYWRQENLHYHIVSQCLHGADIDADAVNIAKTRLTNKSVSPLALHDALNLLICDSLTKWEEITAAGPGDPFSGNPHASLAGFWRQKYDYIIGNPPYISFGLNRVGKMAPAQAEYLRVHYPHSAQYKLSYYALFFERSITALKPGGYLGFITPDSYLLGRYYSKIREYILETCEVRELTLVNSDVFPGALVGIPVITVLRKCGKEGCRPVAAVTVNKLSSSGLLSASHQYGQDYFEHQVYKRFRLFFHPCDKAIIDKIEQAPYMLGHIAKIRTGMRSLTTQSDIKSKRQQGETWRKGLVSSGQVLPFCVKYQGDWLDVNPAKLYKGGWDAAVMAGPKIFLRQTGDSLIATIDKSGFYHLNNIHSLAVTGTGVSLEYLVCILNSTLMNYYYQTVTLEKGRSMAQVDIEMLEKLPLIIDNSRTGELELMGERLTELASTDDPAIITEFNSLYNEMNKTVYEIYGLSETEIIHIEQGIHGGLFARRRTRGRRS